MKLLVSACVLLCSGCDLELKYIGNPPPEEAIARIQAGFIANCKEPIILTVNEYKDIDGVFKEPIDNVFGTIYQLQGNTEKLMVYNSNASRNHGVTYITKDQAYVGIHDAEPQGIYYLMLHELGHMHGLSHNDGEGNLMNELLYLNREYSLNDVQWESMCHSFWKYHTLASTNLEDHVKNKFDQIF